MSECSKYSYLVVQLKGAEVIDIGFDVDVVVVFWVTFRGGM